MQYRTFGKLDFQPSALGFGMMRLPCNEDGVDEELATQMVRSAIDNGLNYIDTAYGYHGGESEKFTGRVLQDGYRDKVKLATKLPQWMVKELDDCQPLLDEQLERLQTDTIDMYLIHALGKNSWEKMKDLGVDKWMLEKQDEGVVKNIGFSFHDNTEALKQIVDEYEGCSFCQIQYNYMDVENQAGTEGLKYAAGKGMGVIVMEPLLGGKLANTPPAAVAEVWDSSDSDRTPADWALQWLWDQPEVSLVLSGMSAMEHVTENMESAESSGADSFSDNERALVAQAREAYKGVCPVPCTTCGYCQPCPSEVKIPRIFTIYNEGHMYNSMNSSKNQYKNMKDEFKADKCVECGKCEDACPQGIAVIEELKKIHADLTV